jgi:hypothetical protein
MSEPKQLEHTGEPSLEALILPASAHPAAQPAYDAARESVARSLVKGD